MPNFSTDMAPLFAQAIARQESDKTGNMGIRSIKVNNPSQVLMESILNNYNRWQSGQQPAPWIKEKPKKFVDFMQRRWAPIGAENDPDNLNVNWAPNVRDAIYKQIGPEEYRRWQEMDFVMNTPPWNQVRQA